jgi:hypothetical protein
MGKIYAGINQTANLIYAPPPNNNLLINGLMFHNQQGYSEYTVTTGTQRISSGFYMYESPATSNVKTATMNDTTDNSITFSGSSNSLYVVQMIEPEAVVDSSNTVTMSVPSRFLNQDMTMLVVADGKRHVAHGKSPANRSNVYFLYKAFDDMDLGVSIGDGNMYAFVICKALPIKITYMGLFLGNIKEPMAWYGDPSYESHRIFRREVNLLYWKTYGYPIGVGTAISATECDVMFPITTSLRVVPSLRATLSDVALVGPNATSGAQSYRHTTASAVSLGKALTSVAARIGVTSASTLVPGAAYRLECNNSGAGRHGLFLFDANP